MSGIEEAKALADKINAGALPFSDYPETTQPSVPLWAAVRVNTMVVAGVIAFIVICILLIIYYRLPGFVACISLIIQVSGVLLALSIPQITLTLTGIARLSCPSEWVLTPISLYPNESVKKLNPARAWVCYFSWF